MVRALPPPPHRPRRAHPRLTVLPRPPQEEGYERPTTRFVVPSKIVFVFQLAMGPSHGAFTERAHTVGKYSESCRCAVRRASPEWTAAERVDPPAHAQAGVGGEPLNSADVRELRRVVAENRRLEERCTRLEADRDAARGDLKVVSMRVRASSWLERWARVVAACVHPQH